MNNNTGSGAAAGAQVEAHIERMLETGFMPSALNIRIIDPNAQEFQTSNRAPAELWFVSIYPSLNRTDQGFSVGTSGEVPQCIVTRLHDLAIHVGSWQAMKMRTGEASISPIEQPRLASPNLSYPHHPQPVGSQGQTSANSQRQERQSNSGRAPPSPSGDAHRSTMEAAALEIVRLSEELQYLRQALESQRSAGEETEPHLLGMGGPYD